MKKALLLSAVLFTGLIVSALPASAQCRYMGNGHEDCSPRYYGGYYRGYGGYYGERYYVRRDAAGLAGLLGFGLGYGARSIFGGNDSDSSSGTGNQDYRRGYRDGMNGTGYTKSNGSHNPNYDSGYLDGQADRNGPATTDQK